MCNYWIDLCLLFIFTSLCCKCRHVPSVHRASAETLYSAGILKPIFTGTPQTANTDTGTFIANLAETLRTAKHHKRGSGVFMCFSLSGQNVRHIYTCKHILRYIIHKSSTIYCYPALFLHTMANFLQLQDIPCS